MGSPAVPAMSMPLRLAVSENAPISFPLAGHVQSSRSSSPLSASAGGGVDSDFASGFADAVGALSEGDADAVAAAALAAAISRIACSEYGSLSAFGADFTLSPGFAATTGGGELGAGLGS